MVTFLVGIIFGNMLANEEQLQKVHTELKKANIDIVIADEGWHPGPFLTG